MGKGGEYLGQKKARGTRGRKEYRQTLRSRKRFGHNILEAKARSSNTTARELMGNDAHTEAVLSFLRETDAGKVNAGVLDRDVG